jgi:D-alanyl-D-alanine carboxypeptidase/D-alanyl-D-alanine-endopeptidase (penicillin-binding protein 4)
MTRRPLLVRFLPVLLPILLAAWLPAHAQLPAAVASALRSATIPEEALSVVVLRDQQTVLSHLADRPVHPASTMKLVTTLVSLDTLGPVFRGRTELRSSGTVQGDTLKGDLVLRGGADADFTTEALTGMLRSLRYQGIRRIDGRVVMDRQLFNPARPDIGAPPFDDAPEAYYNVIPDALLVNKNMLQLDLRSTGSSLKVSSLPEMDGVSVGADMRLVTADCANWDDGGQEPEVQRQPKGRIKVVLHGTFPKNCVASQSINVLDRQDYLDRLLRTTWKGLGGSIEGSTVDGATPPDTRLLAAHVARALPEIVRDTNKPSDNLLARTLFLSLGALEADPVLGSRPQAGAGDGTGGSGSGGTTLARSEAVVRAWMRARGIDDTGLVLENGSGLSRIERITPVQLAGVLLAGQRSNWAPEFQASMPIVAIDGTMRRRLHDSPAAGRARMKTGTLKGVVAIAGYVTDANGRQCVVVAMINSDRVDNGRGRMVLDTLVDWVARMDGGQATQATSLAPAAQP